MDTRLQCQEYDRVCETPPPQAGFSFFQGVKKFYTFRSTTIDYYTFKNGEPYNPTTFPPCNRRTSVTPTY